MESSECVDIFRLVGEVQYYRIFSYDANRSSTSYEKDRKCNREISMDPTGTYMCGIDTQNSYYSVIHKNHTQTFSTNKYDKYS